MPTFTIRGVSVHFPFDPYDVQLIYMEKVIESLQEVRFYSFFVIDKVAG
jgi:hypothetical protein